MKTITKDELKVILKNHRLWLENLSGGMRANLEDANLVGANLVDANLRGANLRDANLRDANLEDANLRGANLVDANLVGANLVGANLEDANLVGANLRDANLRDANLRGANTDKKYISITCIGSRKGMTTFCIDDNKIWCGCWTGTLEEFEGRVRETHKDNEQFLKEYLGAITYFKSFIPKKGKEK